MLTEFVLPDLGEGIAEAQIIRLLVKPGDTVARDQHLMEVETDKARAAIVTNRGIKPGSSVRVK